MAFQPQSANDWLDLILKLVACFGVAWSLYFPCRAIVRRLRKAVLHADGMQAKFGPDPADALHGIIDQLRSHAARHDVLHSITALKFDMAIYICDATGKCTFANQALCRMFRLSSDEMLGYGWLAAITAEEAQQVYSLWKQALEQGTPYRAHYKLHGVECITEAFPTRLDGGIRSYVGYVAPRPS